MAVVYSQIWVKLIYRNINLYLQSSLNQSFEKLICSSVRHLIFAKRNVSMEYDWLLGRWRLWEIVEVLLERDAISLLLLLWNEVMETFCRGIFVLYMPYGNLYLAFFRPFGQCAEFLTVETITDSLMPCVVGLSFISRQQLTNLCRYFYISVSTK